MQCGRAKNKLDDTCDVNCSTLKQWLLASPVWQMKIANLWIKLKVVLLMLRELCFSLLVIILLRVWEQ